LKAAAERPPHLRAIVPIHATADNYNDFLLLGGCPGGFWANADWGPRMIGYNLTPPLCDDPDGHFARLWAARLEQFRPWPLEWYEHGSDPQRWARRAVAVERIEAPTYAVCGWRDLYPDRTLDYFNRIPAPKKLLMGPWKHVFPDLAPVVPVGFLEMMVRWFDRWLKGEANGAEAGPPITLSLQGVLGWPPGGLIAVGDSPLPVEQLRAAINLRGWRQENEWPPHRNQHRELHLAGYELSNVPLATAGDFAGSGHDPTVGLDSLAVDPWTTAIPSGDSWVEESGDHDCDDARSLCFTSAPLEEDWDLTGQARLIFFASAGRVAEPGVSYVAKLCDVSPAGRSRLVTLGWARGPIPHPAESPVEISLRSTSYLFRRGHRIRLSIALADFPRLWPISGTERFWLHCGTDCPSRLLLPRTPAQQPSLSVPEFPPPAEGLKSAAELEAVQRWHVGRELVQRTASLQCHTTTAYQLHDGGTVRYSHDYTATVAASAPAAAEMRSASDIVVQRPSGEVRIQTANVFTATTATINAEISQNGQVIFRRDWTHG
jgi:predicted acyl esterase